eukprot:1157634-Pelagomonas_calceolata.AAC.8
MGLRNTERREGRKEVMQFLGRKVPATQFSHNQFWRLNWILAQVVTFNPSFITHNYLSGGMREMAALILGRLLTRPDMATPLADFVSWSKEALSCTDSVQAPFLVPGA